MLWPTASEFGGGSFLSCPWSPISPASRAGKRSSRGVRGGILGDAVAPRCTCSALEAAGARPGSHRIVCPRGVTGRAAGPERRSNPGEAGACDGGVLRLLPSAASELCGTRTRGTRCSSRPCCSLLLPVGAPRFRRRRARGDGDTGPTSKGRFAWPRRSSTDGLQREPLP